MKKRTLSLLLAGLLTLTLAACGGGDRPTPSSQTAEETSLPPVGTQPSESQPVEETSLPPVGTQPSESQPADELTGVAELGLPERDYQPWQRGYLDLLARLRGEEQNVEAEIAALTEEELEADETLREKKIHGLSDSYCLYDVDKDGVPELLVTFGNADAVHSTRCYTFRDGEAVLAGEFPSAYCHLYTYPDENGFLLGMGLAGHSEVTAYSLEDGQLTEARQLFSEDNAEHLTRADEVVPGAAMLDSYPTRMAGSQTGSGSSWQSVAPLLLPVCDWYDGPPATGSDPEQARAAILAVMEDGAPFISVPPAGLTGAVVRTDLTEFASRWYIDEGALPYELTAYAWQDLNLDGQEECLIQLTSSYEDGSWTNDRFFVLSEQDGEVYGYDANSSGTLCFVYTDGTLRHNSICWAISFWKEQCYEYYPTAFEMPNENYVRYDESAECVERVWLSQGEE